MQHYPTVHVITGPPGSGKTTYARTHFPNLPVFDRDLRNKDEWRKCRTDCVLLTSAPSRENKAYWVDEIVNDGRIANLLVMWVPRMVAYDRMKARNGQTPTQRNDLEKSVERWYKLYSPYPSERRIDNS